MKTSIRTKKQLSSLCFFLDSKWVLQQTAEGSRLKKKDQSDGGESGWFFRLSWCWRHSSSHNERKLGEWGSSGLGWDTIKCLSAWARANSHPPFPTHTHTHTHSSSTQHSLKLPVYNCSQMFTAAKFHFLLLNPIAHYPVHCIRALIFLFSSLEEERSAFVINPLYSNK